MPLPDPTKIKTFASSHYLGEWLMENHDIEKELWIKIFKKKTGIASVTWDDVVIKPYAGGGSMGSRNQLMNSHIFNGSRHESLKVSGLNETLSMSSVYLMKDG